MANNPEPTWRASAGGPRRPDKKYGWKPPEAEAGPAGWKRPVKLFALAAGGVAVVGGIVWLIMLLLRPAPPGLITIAADPEVAADQLDVPYDPYGWLSANRLVAWAKAAQGGGKSPKVLAEKPEWVDDADAWLDKLRGAKADPVVIYVGLHGGVGPDGKPVLYTGRNPRSGDARTATVPLTDLIDKLNTVADKRKLLVLDTGRGLPDPHLGEVNHDFIRAVKAADVQEKIKASPNLVVVCGADEGQRGWDSADLGMTALAYHLMKGLSGPAAPPDKKSFTADDLYRYVRREVNEWAKNNRPSAQEPVMFPDPAADDRAVAGYDQRKFLVADGGPPLADFVVPGPTQLPEAARDQWKRCARLAAEKVPGPATYTPLAWRRYRELLLRFEEAAMAGDPGGQRVLGAALDRTVAQIEAGLRLDLASTGWALPLPAAAGQPGPDRLADALWQLTDPADRFDLRQAADQVGTAVRGRAQRPVEAHLLAMTDYFYTKVVREDLPPADLWKPAGRARLLAEQAATGLRRDDKRYPYSEAVWPLVRKAVLDADAVRRQAEDAMFAGTGGRDYHKQARDGFAAAAKGYEDALAAVRGVQDGLRVRDELFADLPFLSRWVAEADSSTAFVADAAHKRAGELWVSGHQLSARLDGYVTKGTPPPAGERETLARDAAALAAGLKELKDRFADQVGGVGNAIIQAQLQPIEALLLVPVPVLDPDRRAQLVETRRRIEKGLHENKTPLGAELKPFQPEKVRRRAEVALKVFGDPEWDQKVRRETPQHDLGSALRGLLNDKLDLKDTTEAAAAVAANRRAVAEAALPGADKPELRVPAERFSRVAVAATDWTAVEPAVVNRRVRWRALLEGQAARVARDHWYDENQNKTFATVADAFLKDAAALAELVGEKDAPPSEDAREAVALKGVPGLTLAADVAGGQAIDGNIRWTTEPARELRLALTGGGPPLTGAAVLWAGSEKPDWLAAAGGPRQPIDLPKAGEPAAPAPVRIQAGRNLLDSASTAAEYVNVTADGFFRGQRVGAAVRFAVNSRPDLVVTETKPDPGAMIALRAGDNLDPGRITVVVDFSGSMRADLAGVISKDEHRDPRSRMALALRALRDVLKSLPASTKVSIRAFSHVTDPDDRTQTGQEDWLRRRAFTEKIFPRKDREVADEFKAREDDVFGRLARLYPYHLTPLVDALNEAVADPDDFPPDDGTPQTLLVLTDGANTVLDGRQVEPTARDTIAQVRDRVKRFRTRLRSNVAVHMLFFISDTAEKEKNEADAAWAMFADLEDPSGQATAGKRWRANDAEELRRRLEKVFRPRARLFYPGGRAVEAVPAFGMPANRQFDGPGALWWYGPQKIDTAQSEAYNLEFARSAVELRVAAGDRLVVKLGSGGSQRATFTREVYYKDVDKRTPGNRVTDEHPDWFLAVPSYNYERPGNSHFLMATAALEAKTRGPGGDDGLLKQPRPRFLWWELTRLDGTTERVSERTVYVRNVRRNQLPAPAWRVIADDGPTAKMQAARNRLRAFALRDRDPDALATLDVPNPSRLEGAPRPFAVRGEPVTVTVGLEEIAFYPDPEVDSVQDQPGAKNLCLVVRATDARGRILQARVRGLGAVAAQEHRYFYVKDGKTPPGQRPPVAGYTGIFGPVGRETVANLGELTVELISVTDVMNDPRAAQLALELEPPSTGQSRPDIIEPGLTADLGLK